MGYLIATEACLEGKLLRQKLQILPGRIKLFNKWELPLTDA